MQQQENQQLETISATTTKAVLGDNSVTFQCTASSSGVWTFTGAIEPGGTFAPVPVINLTTDIKSRSGASVAVAVGDILLINCPSLAELKATLASGTATLKMRRNVFQYFTNTGGSAGSGSGQPNVDSYTQAAINLGAGANQSLVTAPGANKQIWVYGLGFSVNVAGTVSFQDEDDTAISGILQVGATGGFVSAPSGNFAMPMWKVATNKALEVDVVTSELDGWITYGIVSV